MQTIRDGLLSATDLAALLPATGRLTPGELLALVDSAALGLTAPGEPASVATADAGADRATDAHVGAPVWLVAYLLGALATGSSSAPVQPSTRTAPPAPVRHDTQNGTPAPVHAPRRTDRRTDSATASGNDDRTDAELLALVRHQAATEHDGAPMSQRAIRRVTGVGTQRAKRLAELAGWTESTTGNLDTPTDPPQTRGQLQLVTEPGENATDDNDTNPDTDKTSHELESSSSR